MDETQKGELERGLEGEEREGERQRDQDCQCQTPVNMEGEEDVSEVGMQAE